jgi:hypothetical protein
MSIGHGMSRFVLKSAGPATHERYAAWCGSSRAPLTLSAMQRKGIRGRIVSTPTTTMSLTNLVGGTAIALTPLRLFRFTISISRSGHEQIVDITALLRAQ